MYSGKVTYVSYVVGKFIFQTVINLFSVPSCHRTHNSKVSPHPQTGLRHKTLPLTCTYGMDACVNIVSGKKYYQVYKCKKNIATKDYDVGTLEYSKYDTKPSDVSI